METFVLLISMWGNDGLDWVYMGNQYVYNTPMTEVECTRIAEESSWTRWENNQFYRISIECVPNNKNGA